MLTVLHSVHTLNAERLASKSVTLKPKHLVTQILEDGPEEECKEFLQHVEGLHISCIVYLNVRMKQYDELSAFCCLGLSDPMSWGKFQLVIHYVLSKCVTDNTKYSDDFCHLKKYVKKKV
jgi:hypothetical protein